MPFIVTYNVANLLLMLSSDDVPFVL